MMESSGFVRYPTEWWHYTLEDEPYRDTYFDFPIAWVGPHASRPVGRQPVNSRRGSCTLTRRPTLGAGAESQDAVVSPRDARDDREAEPDTRVVVAQPSAPRWNGSVRVDTVAGVSSSPVFSTVSVTVVGSGVRDDPDVAVFGEIVHDRVVEQVRRQLQQQARASRRRERSRLTYGS